MPRRAVYVVYIQGQPVGHDEFLEKPHAMRLRPAGDLWVVKVMVFPKLMHEILWALDRTCHQLRKEHDVGGVNDKVLLRFLFSPVHLDHIAQTLEGVKGKPDR